MIIAGLGTFASSPAPAGKPAPLDREFLDYLAACEGKDDNWTVVADGKQDRKGAQKSPPKVPSEDKAAAKPEAKP